MTPPRTRPATDAPATPDTPATIPRSPSPPPPLVQYAAQAASLPAAREAVREHEHDTAVILDGRGPLDTRSASAAPAPQSPAAASEAHSQAPSKAAEDSALPAASANAEESLESESDARRRQRRETLQRGAMRALPYVRYVG